MSEIKRFKLKSHNARNKKVSELRISTKEALMITEEIQQLEQRIVDLQKELDERPVIHVPAKREEAKDVAHVDTTLINIISQVFKTK